MKRSAVKKPLSFPAMQADYDAAKTSRFVRHLEGVSIAGSSADWHFRNEMEFLKLIEAARAIDRNNMVVGQAVTRLVNNVVQQGFALNATTGDAELDRYLTMRWHDWTKDPDVCDVARNDSFLDLTRQALRACIVDGDVFAVLTSTGHVQLMEAHRVRTPIGAKDTVLGVSLNGVREHIAYHFTREPIDVNQQARQTELVRVPVRRTDDQRQVLHVLDRRRVSQTRGVTAFAPMLGVVNMHEDLQFAQLVKAEVAAAFAILREREMGVDIPSELPPTGETYNATWDSGGGSDLVQDIGPGMEWVGQPGERLTGFSPNVPNPEFFEHAKLILTFIAINLELPVAVLLLDPSDTNFSGYRGAIDQARQGWQKLQHLVIGRFCRPVYEWRVREWARTDPRLRDVPIERLLAHEWNPPYWPYIEPNKDALGDKVIIGSHLNSRRKLLARRGLDIDVVDDEHVADEARLIERAVIAADKLNAKYETAHVDWREIIGMQPRTVGAQVEGEPEAQDEADEDAADDEA